MDTRAGKANDRASSGGRQDLHGEILLGISFALAIFLCLFVLPRRGRDVRTVLPTYLLSRAAARSFSLLSKCVESDYGGVQETRRGSRKTACRSLDDIGYSRYRALSGICRIILVISRLIRAENTRWKSNAVVRPRYSVIYMHDCEAVLP